MTYFRAQKSQTIDAGVLQAWRAKHLDQDDVFHPDFLQGVIFGGVKSDEVHLTCDAKTLLEDWNTASVVYEPHLELKDGPYYVSRGILHSIWRIYEDHQLAFLQATWPTEDDDE